MMKNRYLYRKILLLAVGLMLLIFALPALAQDSPPVFKATPATETTLGQPYAVYVSASGTPEPTFSLDIAPAGMTINSLTGLINWTAPALGDYAVSVIATNSVGADTLNYTLKGVAFHSDDFNNYLLDTTIWTFIDPKGDASYSMAGTGTSDAFLNFSLPAASEHDVWTGGNKSARIMQPAANVDFETEIKFESVFSARYQLQGLIVEDNPNNYIRFDFYYDGALTRMFIAPFVNNNPSIKFNNVIPNAATLYMRVSRTGNNWSVSYSPDSSAWTPITTFSHTMTVSSIGPFAGNAHGSTSPAFEGLIDYFANSDLPLANEDVGSPEPVAPIITSLANTNTLVDQLYQYDVEALGYPDPVFHLTQAPAGMTIDSVTGLVSWIPTSDGLYNFAVEAINSGGADTQTVALNVNSMISSIPNISSSPVTDALVGALYSYDVNASGVPVPSYSLTVAPAGMTIDPASGLINWTPTTPGDYDVTVKASNSEGDDYQIFTISVVEILISNIQSDDFNHFAIDTTLWTIIDPVGDATIQTVGTNTSDALLNLSLPGGTEHDIWTTGNNSVRLIQAVNNADFEVEAKFQTDLTSQFQMVGILSQQDDSNFVRYDYYSNGTGTYLIAAVFTNLSASIKFNNVVTDGNPLYMRVKRTGNDWLLTYSSDGITWNTATTFTHAMTLTGIGPYAANAPGTSSPANDAYVDYFFNTAAPIDPEDGDTTQTSPPFFVSNPIMAGVIDSLYSYDANANGYPTPYYSLLSGPAGLTVDSASGLVEWIPVDEGTFPVSIEAINASGSDIQNYSIVVDSFPGSIPVITSTPTTTMALGNSYSYQATADGYPTPYFSLVNPPSGMTVDSATGLVEWTPATSGSFNLELVASNSYGDDTQIWTLDVIAPTLPVISIWYGKNQSFGDRGMPQRWVNILGNVSDPDGLAYLRYSLNGAPDSNLTIGPDTRRLENIGDFNIDLSVDDLLDGGNELIVKAEDNIGNLSVDTVTVNFTRNQNWPIPYSVGWDTVSNLGDVGQVVDGKWGLVNNKLQPTEIGYDRLVGFGDTLWSNYEVVVPITVNSIASGGGIGFIMRWEGHTDDPIAGWQPTTGWLPLGAILWYRNYYGTHRLEVFGNNGSTLASQNKFLIPGTEYMFKMRVEDEPGVHQIYSFKVWENGTSEPGAWDVVANQNLLAPSEGATFLVVHDCEAEIGDISITDIYVPIDSSLTIGNIASTTTDSSATVSWISDKPSTTILEYGTTTAYELGTITDNNMVLNHSVDLSGLLENTTYHFRASSVNTYGVADSSADMTFKTKIANLAGPVSDDFNTYAFDPNVWTTVDPVGDASFNLTGTNTANAWAVISLPGGTDHDVWRYGNKSARIMQPIADGDFEVEAKFESVVNQQYQMQGILVEADANNFIRFDFLYDGSNLKFYAASFNNLSPATRINQIITLGAPMYIKVKRVGDNWTGYYSSDGTTWTTAGNFNFNLGVTAVGPFAAVALGSSSPPLDCQIDYFFNSADPIALEDGQAAPEVAPTIVSSPVTSAIVGAAYSYDVNAAANPAATYSLNISPSGMTIDANSGVINWTPTVAGDYSVEVLATNSQGSDNQPFTINVTEVPTDIIVSDDFNSAELNTTLWTFINPVGDASIAMNGTGTTDAWATITLPGGAEHDVWISGNNSARIMQPSNDVDFEVEVKFEAVQTARYIMQGIIIEQDATNFIRFDFLSDGTSKRFFAASFVNLSSSVKTNQVITDTAPQYLKVSRTGNTWRGYYSLNGVDWILATTFNHTLTVTAVGPFTGNAHTTSSPAFVCDIDYFFNSASPIVPEDNNATASAVYDDHYASSGCCFGLSGNLNGDQAGLVDIEDLVYMVQYQFHQGPAPECMDAADLTGDGLVDIEDLVYLVNYQFRGGDAPLECNAQ